jgi:hypothetical protein
VRIAEWLLSKLFPPKLDLRLKQKELNETIEYRRRRLFANGHIYVWSSWTGNKREHPAPPKPTIQEKRQREIPYSRFNGRVYSSVLEHLRDVTAAGTGLKTQTTNPSGIDSSRVQSGKKLVRYN